MKNISVWLKFGIQYAPLGNAILIPFPNYREYNFSFPFSFPKVGNPILIPIPVSKIWEWIELFLFPFPNPKKSFPLTPDSSAKFTKYSTSSHKDQSLIKGSQKRWEHRLGSGQGSKTSGDPLGSSPRDNLSHQVRTGRCSWPASPAESSWPHWAWQAWPAWDSQPHRGSRPQWQRTNRQDSSTSWVLQGSNHWDTRSPQEHSHRPCSH